MVLSWASDPFLLKATIIVGSGGLIFGYDIGVISGTLSTLQTTFGLSAYEEGLVVSILYAGSIVGCLLGGPLCDIFGRWKTIQLQNLVFIVGAVVTGFARNKSCLYLGRFLVGVASSISGLADVPYLTEIAPAEFRGIISGQYEILVAFGILLSFGLDVAFDLFPGGWRIAFLVPGIFALMQSLGMLLLPESPKWLLSKNAVTPARKALCSIHSFEVIDEWQRLYQQQYSTSNKETSENAGTETALIPVDVLALFALEDQLGKTLSTAGVDSKPSLFSASTIRRHLCGDATEQQLMSEYRYPIALVVVFQVLAQITGSNVVRNYAAVIFESNGASKRISLALNVILGVVKWFFTVLAVFFVEEQGRRWLFLLGSGMVTLGMLILSLASVFSPEFNLHNMIAFIMGCIMIYAGFGVGYGPIPWILSSEMIPTDIRGRIMSVSLIASNIAQLVTNMMFLPITHAWTTTGSFGMFSILNIFTWCFIYLWFCETKDVLPSEIKKSLLRQYNTVRWMCLQGNLLGLCFIERYVAESTLQLRSEREGGYGRVPDESAGTMLDISVSANHSSDSDVEVNRTKLTQASTEEIYQTVNPLL
jgi:MFS family permease